VTDEPPLAQEAPRGPTLNYGRGDHAGDAWRWLKPLVDAVWEATQTLFGKMIVPALGGWRQVGFAIGLAIVLAGLGDCIASRGSNGGAFWMFAGGLAVGLSLRVTNRGRDR
jgi:hypothetical protein